MGGAVEGEPMTLAGLLRETGGVPVPSGRYRPELVEPLGGRLCLDFTNTAVWRLRPQPDDALAGYGDLLTWAELRGALPPEDIGRLRDAAAADPAAAAAVFARARTLREALYRLFLAEIAGEAPRPEDLDPVNAELGAAMARIALRPADGGLDWTWRDPGAAPDLARPLWPIVRSAADLLVAAERERVKRCPGEGCGWLFLDTSRNGSRRWCDMAVCGNRARVRAFAARRRAGKQSPDGYEE